MKRVKAACIHQMLHFMAKDETEALAAAKLVDEELAKYKDHLNRSKIQYKILSETRQEDGSVLLDIIKQYNTAPVGTFLD